MYGLTKIGSHGEALMYLLAGTGLNLRARAEGGCQAIGKKPQVAGYGEPVTGVTDYILLASSGEGQHGWIWIRGYGEDSARG